MHTILLRLVGLFSFTFAVSTQFLTTGIEELLRRRLPDHADQFSFVLSPDPSNSHKPTAGNGNVFDRYLIDTSDDGRVRVQGNTLSALNSGLHRYLTDVLHVDIWWFVGSRLDEVKRELPRPAERIEGESVVRWRHYFNTGETLKTKTRSGGY